MLGKIIWWFMKGAISKMIDAILLSNGHDQASMDRKLAEIRKRHEEEERKEKFEWKENKE